MTGLVENIVARGTMQLKYASAGPKIRQAILRAAIKSVEGLPQSITTGKEATEARNTMAAASQLIKTSQSVRQNLNQAFMTFHFTVMDDLFKPALSTQDLDAGWDNIQHDREKTVICKDGEAEILKELESYAIRRKVLKEICAELRNVSGGNPKKREAIICLHDAILLQDFFGVENTEKLIVAAVKALDLVTNPLEVGRAEDYARDAQATLHQSKGSLAMLRISQLMLGLCAIAIALCVAGVVVAAPVSVAVAAVGAVGAYMGSNHFFAKSKQENLPLAAKELARTVSAEVIALSI